MNKQQRISQSLDYYDHPITASKANRKTKKKSDNFTLIAVIVYLLLVGGAILSSVL